MKFGPNSMDPPPPKMNNELTTDRVLVWIRANVLYVPKGTCYIFREGVGASNFRTTTGHFFFRTPKWNACIFLVHHYYDIRMSKCVLLVDQNTQIDKDQNYDNQNIENQTNWLLMFWFYLWRQKRSERRKSKISTTYGVLPIFTKACGGSG